MTAHTPGPWALRQPRTRLGKDYRIEGADSTVGVLSSKYNTRIAADAARIVACVNYCAGIGSELLTGKLGDVFADEFRRQDAEKTLRAQIQTLREALNELHANTENRQDEPFIGYVRKTCAAALEETK